jgi:hypothetical protein
MAEFMAYYRVSTDRQGASGLGLAAQREAVARFLGAGYLSRNVAAPSPHGRSIGSSPKRGAPRACRPLSIPTCGGMRLDFIWRTRESIRVPCNSIWATEISNIRFALPS